MSWFQIYLSLYCKVLNNMFYANCFIGVCIISAEFLSWIFRGLGLLPPLLPRPLLSCTERVWRKKWSLEAVRWQTFTFNFQTKISQVLLTYHSMVTRQSYSVARMFLPSGMYGNISCSSRTYSRRNPGLMGIVVFGGYILVAELLKWNKLKWYLETGKWKIAPNSILVYTKSTKNTKARCQHINQGHLNYKYFKIQHI